MLLIDQVICPKCCWKLEAAAQLSSVKMRICKTSQISQKEPKMGTLFVKLRALKPATVLKRTLSLALSCEYIYVNIFFHFLRFCFRRDKSSHRRCSVKKGVLINFTGKNLCWCLFLTKLQIFKNTYFEEHLWATASKKINNICLIV